MIKTWPKMVREFQEACEDIDSKYPVIPDVEVIDLRRRLINEEYTELLEALDENDIGHIAKELCDLIYVCIGTGLVYGINMDKAFSEVHRSNMTKFSQGQPKRYPNGKIIKPPTYEEADMSIIYERK